MVENAGESRRQLTLKEAAATYDVNYATLRRAVAEGRLQAQRMGDLVWLVEASEVERFTKKRNGRRKGPTYGEASD